MDLGDIIKRGLAGAQAAGRVLKGPAKPKRPYELVVTLSVRATNKAVLEKAVKATRARLEQLGPSLLSALGAGDDVQFVSADVEIQKGGEKCSK